MLVYKMTFNFKSYKKAAAFFGFVYHKFCEIGQAFKKLFGAMCWGMTA